MLPGPARVAFICSHGSPAASPGAGAAGGLQVYVRELARAVAARGVRVDVVVGDPGPPAPPAALAPGVRLIGPAAAFAHARAYAVVHGHYWRSGPLARALAAAAGGVPLVHTHHTVGAVRAARRAPREAAAAPERLAAEAAVLGAADLVIASTAAERAAIDHPHVAVIAPGVDLARFHPRPAPASPAPVFVAVGRLEPVKGFELAIDALAAVRHPGARLLIAGEGRERRALAHHAAARGVGARVELLGRVDQAALPALLRVADAALVTSHAETFCLAALEALACGTPVVGTRVGGLPLLVGEDRLVRARDADALAARLDAVVAGGDVVRAAAAASAARFPWSRTAAAVLDAYAAVLTRARCGGTPRRTGPPPARRSPRSAARTPSRSATRRATRPAPA
jgi:D-inositol-3-phosphate glycosyltransferase